MTTICDKKGCGKTSEYSKDNARMYKLDFSGCPSDRKNPEPPEEQPIDIHLCWKHRKELAKLILDWKNSP